MKGNRRKVILAFTLCAALAMGSGCSLLPVREENRVAPIAQSADEVSMTTYTVVTGDAEDDFLLNVTVNYSDAEQMFFEYGDFVVEKVYTEVGAEVKKGDLLLEAKSDELRNTVNEYQKAYDSYLAHIDYYSGLIDIEDEKKTVYANYGLTYESDVLSSYNVELDNNKKALEVVKKQLEEAQANLDACRIYAPFDGVVTYLAEMGGSYMKGLPVATVSQSNLYVTATTDKTGYFDVGEEYSVEYSGKINEIVEDSEGNMGHSTQTVYGSYTVVCESIEPVNENSDAYQIKFEVKDDFPQTEGLSLNYSRIVIPLSRVENVTVIPAEALITSGDKNMVYMVGEDGSRFIQEIEVGVVGSDTVEVKSGLKPGDKIVR